MKSYLISLAIVASLLVPSAFAFAQQASSTPQGNGDPMNIGMPWGLTGYQTPLFSQGKSVTDKGGMVLSCPFFQGCFDLTQTPYYNTAMVSTVEQLKALGYTSATVASQWSGWLSL